MAFQCPTVYRPFAATYLAMADTATEPASSTSTPGQQDPLLIRAARGEKTERTPVWMMRQAGRHIAEYRDLCKEYPTFRQRSEIPEVAVEVSLQPWRNYKTDACILFSDILTPLPGMGCEFVIDEKVGPLMEAPIRSWDDAKKVRWATERLVEKLRKGWGMLTLLQTCISFSLNHRSIRLIRQLPRPLSVRSFKPCARKSVPKLLYWALSDALTPSPLTLLKASPPRNTWKSRKWL